MGKEKGFLAYAQIIYMIITALFSRKASQILHLSNQVVQVIVCIIDLCIAEKRWFPLGCAKIQKNFKCKGIYDVLTASTRHFIKQWCTMIIKPVYVELVFSSD